MAIDPGRLSRGLGGIDRLPAGLQIGLSALLLFIATLTMPNAPEVVRSPVADLWLPRLLAGNLGQSMAQLRWGLDGAWPLLVLGAAATVTLLALYATTAGRGRRQ